MEQARVQARSEGSAEVAKLKNELAITTGLVASGGQFTNKSITKAVEHIRQAREVKDFSSKFNEHDMEITVSAVVDGTPLTYKFDNLAINDFYALKLVFAVFENMYSKAYSAASNAMGNLITEILTSSSPQPHHFKQIEDLSTASKGLEAYLKYHQEISAALQSAKAIPLAKFLNVKFLAPSAINQMRERVLKGFLEVDDIIKHARLPDQSPSLVGFLDKIRESISLPSSVSFSEEEIANLLKELGFLLEDDDSGEIIVGGDYFEGVNKLVQLLNSIAIAIKKKHESIYATVEVAEEEKQKGTGLFTRVSQAILANNLRDSCFGELVDLCSGKSIDTTVALPAKEFLITLKEIGSAAPVTPTLAYQDGKELTKTIMRRIGGSTLSSSPSPSHLPVATLKLDETALKPFKAVLFLMQVFAKPQYEKVIDKSILSNKLKLDEKAALSLYFQYSIHELQRAFSVVPTDFVLSVEDHEKLRKSESITFIDMYVKSVMDGKPISADFATLKATVLGMTPEVAIKSNLTLRVCEFLALDSVSKSITEEKRIHAEKEEREAKAAKEKGESYTGKAFDARKKIEPQLSSGKVKEITEIVAYYNGNPAITRSLLSFKILGNDLATDNDKGDLVDAYFRLDSGLSVNKKAENLRKFLGQSLAGSAKSGDFVTAALSLPTIKTDYEMAYSALGKTLGQFADDPNKKVLEGLMAFSSKALSNNLDTLATVSKHLGNLTDSLKVIRDFLTKGNDSKAVATSHGSMAKSPFIFVVAAGLQTLEFSKLFKCDNYFDSLYSAAKALHYLELTMPSDNDLEFLKSALITVPGIGTTEIAETTIQIDAVIELVKSVKVDCANFFEQIKKVLRFATEFKLLKDKYDSPTGTETLDLYANIDKLVVPLAPPAFPDMAASVKSPLGSQAVVFSDERGLAKFNLPSEDSIYRKLSIDPATVQGASQKELDIMLQKKIAYYKELLQEQLRYFSQVDFTKINESNTVHFVRQLMSMIDLYMRVKLYDEFSKAAAVDTTHDLRPVKEAVTEFKDKGSAYRAAYFNI
ncbi:MAG: hypothetical protein NT128_00765, partial [Proteobacteria bacterium]|nr:hypothetical protein [Pseudomonadota bacterium]